MALPTIYSTSQVIDTFTVSSDTDIESHTPDTDVSGSGYTLIDGSITVDATGDYAYGPTSNNDNNCYLAGVTIGGDFLMIADVVFTGGTVGSTSFWGPLFAVVGGPGKSFGLSISVGNSAVRLTHYSVTDGYDSTDIYTIPNDAWLTTSHEFALERVGDTIYGYIDGTQEGSMDLSGTTDFSGSPTISPGLQFGNWTPTERMRVDNYTVKTVPAGSSSIPVIRFHLTQQGIS